MHTQYKHPSQLSQVEQIRRHHFLPPYWSDEEVMYFDEQLTQMAIELLEAETKAQEQVNQTNQASTEEESNNDAVIMWIMVLIGIIVAVGVLVSK